MLVHLSISNSAIIKRLDIELEPGLNILSGETGAGKSIIINAVNLILGGRAASDLIRTGCNEARVEAMFRFSPRSGVDDLLEALGLPRAGGEVLISRSLFKEGRNRVTVNGAMATLQMLNRLGESLISISGQHEHQRLLRPENHLHLLDDFGGLTPQRLQLAADYEQYREACDRIERLRETL
ncbi:MAG: DNA repair protein RecN, partial [Deltaproteobacteria bacterium]